MDIGTWLRSLGPGQYEAKFRENEIETDVLPELTAQHLKDLGISLGHQLKMLRAIRAFGAGDTPEDRPAGSPEPKPRNDAERRHLTVMFCDLVGSTAMSAKLDPEDMREIIGAYHRCCAEQIERSGGFVAKYIGDGVLAYFGYPQAHEHDAERAVHAALSIVNSAAKLKTAATAPLQVRIGIATGPVIVGDLIGAGAAQEQAVVGETPNLAARLQTIAEPDTIVIAESTRRLLGNLFELQDLGAKDLKGIASPARAWAALRPSSAESRFEALHASGLTALVGREEEVELLLRRWSKAKSGEGQVVLLSGEAGIGKSRLIAALLERLSREPHAKLRYFCSPQHTDSAFYPIIRQMERAVGLSRDDVPPAKLDAFFAQTSTSIEDTALFAEMLSLPNDGRYPALNQNALERRQRTLEALVTQVEALTRQNPMLMILEDAHWCDPTTLEAFGRTVDRIAGLRALLIVTFRPEFEAPWIGRPYVTALTINRLTQGEIDAMIDRVAGNRRLAASLRQDIVERTDGIPLFVEEMTKAVLEAESEGETRRTVAAIPSPALAVPASLHASLMARLDRLGSAKEVAQIGAAIGREFSYALLAAVTRKPEVELGFALDRLVAAGLLFRQGVPPHATYLFKHALVQDAAYGTLLREPRRALHARIAEAIENHFAEIAEIQPELLARHFNEAGLIEKAAHLWGKAGQRSLARSALVEATEQLTRALAQIAALPATPALGREQIRLQVALIASLFHVKGYAAPETKAASERARLLIEQAEAIGEPLEDPLLLFSVLFGFWVASYVVFKDDVVDLAAQFLALAEKQPGVAPLMMGHGMIGISLAMSGDPGKGRPHLDQAIALYDPKEHGQLARFGHDFGVQALCYRSWALWLLGFPEAARPDAEKALKTAQGMRHPATLMFTLAHTAALHHIAGEYTEAAEQARELNIVAGAKGAREWKAAATMIQIAVHALSGKASTAIQMLPPRVSGGRSTGSTIWGPWYFSCLGRAHAELGNHDEAWRCAARAMSLVETTAEKWYEAEVHRTAGEIALLSPQPHAAKAEAYFERALTVARSQQAKSWELRAVMSMARLWRDQDRRAQAYDLLAPVYGWFTEGFDTLDLKEAKILLDALAS